MRRVRSALNILLGLSEDPAHGYRWKVECRPEAWRCSICGGGLVMVAPPGRPLVHHCNNPSALPNPTPPPSRIVYMGPRAHTVRVWASLWGNRPRRVSGQRRAGERVPSGLVPPRGPSGMSPSPDGSR